MPFIGDRSRRCKVRIQNSLGLHSITQFKEAQYKCNSRDNSFPLGETIITTKYVKNRNVTASLGSGTTHMHTESKNLISSRDVKFLKDIENNGNHDVFDKSTQNRRDFSLINNIRRAASLNGVDI